MRSLCILSFGLLLAAGCADTADQYDVNKPVITEPVPHVPAAQPENDDAIDDATDNNGATSDRAAPGASSTNPAASGAIENDATLDETESVTP